MTPILLSIRPRYAELIYAGKKTVEYRKTIPVLDPPYVVFFYESRPVKLVTGFATVSGVLKGCVDDLVPTLPCGGLTERELRAYFASCNPRRVCHALYLQSATRLTTPLDPREIDAGFVPWQNFGYPSAALKKTLDNLYTLSTR